MGLFQISENSKMKQAKEKINKLFKSFLARFDIGITQMCIRDSYWEMSQKLLSKFKFVWKTWRSTFEEAVSKDKPIELVQEIY